MDTLDTLLTASNSPFLQNSPLVAVAFLIRAAAIFLSRKNCACSLLHYTVHLCILCIYEHTCITKIEEEVRKLKARENCRFRLPDADLLRMCVDWAADNTKQPAEFTSEIYDIINANLAQFNIEFYHGSAICDEVRQNCALKIFRYTIPKMLADVAKATRVKPHSYIFQAAYFEVMQYVRKFKRRHRLSFDVNELNELLGELVFADGRKTTTKSNEIDKFHEVVGNG